MTSFARLRSYLFLILLFTSLCAQAQENAWSADAQFYYGTILQHNPDIGHLITGHPTGAIFSWQRKTYGTADWEAYFNYPDYGATLTYQNLQNPVLGHAVGLMAHMNFYFFKRNMQFKVAQGIAWVSNPYDQFENPRNNAYGTPFTSTTMIQGMYHRPNVYRGFGFQAGASIIHYSNANVRAPNNSTNTWAFTLGINYQHDWKEEVEYLPKDTVTDWSEPIHYNFVVRAGIHESDVVRLGQHPFYAFSAYADKRLNKKSSLHAGAELIITPMFTDLVRLQSVRPDNNGRVAGDEDHKRVGIFVGHELHIGRMSIITQLGYYVYYPFDFEGRVYNRVGLQYKISDALRAGVSLRSHGAKAEGASLNLGYRL